MSSGEEQQFCRCNTGEGVSKNSSEHVSRKRNSDCETDGPSNKKIKDSRDETASNYEGVDELEALDRAIETFELLTPPVTPIHFTIQELPVQDLTQNMVTSIQAPGNNGGERELKRSEPTAQAHLQTPVPGTSKNTSARKITQTSRNNGESCPIPPQKMGLGQLGRWLIGETDTKKQICPFCEEDTNTRNNNNPTRDLIDHIYAEHFTNEIGSQLRKVKPFLCPLGGNGCKKGKDWGTFQDVMRHYSGTKHGIAMKLVLSYLQQKFEAELNQ